MRTSEDARRSGLYASDCCGEELVFYKHDTFWRCPRCHNLCEWELVEGALSPDELESVQEAEPALASVR
jgi:pyruvate-formate lyase-activating enzyme